MAQFIKRKERGNEASQERPKVSIEQTDGAFAKKYPATAEFLAVEEWSPEQARERGTLTVFWEDGMFKAAINDRDGEQVAFVSKVTFLALLDAIERGFVKDDHDWRSTRAKGKPKWKRS